MQFAEVTPEGKFERKGSELLMYAGLKNIFRIKNGLYS